MTITLDEWVAQFPGIKQKSRDLWKAIRWEFEEQKPPMTVRQMFYRMSSKGYVAKTENGYRQVQHALSEMRRGDAIPYSWIADNTRWVRKPETFNGLDAALEHMQTYYRRSLWATQPSYVEVWLEKDALAGVIRDVTSEFDVPLYVTRGYPSLSYLHNAAQALREIHKPIHIYHFGDFDASGKDAARAIREGLRDFGAEFTFTEVAVLEYQIGAYNLQTRPAKGSDPRAANWGSEAVELDAIEPSLLRAMVRSTILQNIDEAEMNFMRQIEEQERARLEEMATAFRGGAHFGTSTKMPQAQPALQFKRGQRVRHGKFGEGVVISSRWDGQDEEVQVRFTDFGIKMLSAAFANLVVLGEEKHHD